MRRVSPLQWLVTVVAIYRVSLLGRGAMAFVDETWYYRSVLFLDDLSRGHFQHAFSNLDNLGRPGDLFVKLVPAALQAVPLAFGIAPSNPTSLLIPTACNVAITLITLVLFYRICLLLLEGDQLVSLTAAAIYSLLVNTNIYVRHTLPYDWSLCLFTYALWLALSRPLTPRLAWAIGGLAAAVGLIYPGYYPLAAVLAVVVVARDAVADKPIGWWSHAWRFGAGALLAVLVIDLFCNLGDRSYFWALRRLNNEQSGFVRGAYEGWAFIPRYLLEVEGYGGVLLLAGLAGYVARAFAQRGPAVLRRRIHWLVAPAAIIWAAQAIASSPGHHFLFSGRVIHPWFLFLVWTLGDAILWIPRPAARRAVCAAALVVSLVSWAAFVRTYSQISYPRDVLYALAIDTTRVPASQRSCEMYPINAVYESPSAHGRAAADQTNAAQYILINFCQGFPTSEEPRRPSGIEKAALIFDGRHFMTLQAYSAEGYNVEDRHALLQRAYRVQVYALTDRP